MIIRLSLTLCFYKRDLHLESCRVEVLNTRELSNRCRIILKHRFF